MVTKLISPFNGDPPTQEITGPDGSPGFKVTPYELTPLRAKIADRLGILTALALNITGLLNLDSFGADRPSLWAVILFGPWLLYPLFWRTYRALFKKQTEIVMTPDQFKVRDWDGWRVYDRTLTHKFALLVHDKARDEKDAHELAARQAQANGHIVAYTRYYGESFHVVFEYLGQRQDVLTVFGKKEAIAVVSRLKACDERLDHFARMGEGISLDPREQWDESPGGIV